MKQITITILNRQSQYGIFVDKGLIEKLSAVVDLSQYSKIAVITDENIKSLFLDRLLLVLPKDSVSIILASGEKSKNIKSIEIIWKTLLENRFDRKSLVINLGGGVITDMGGFAAGTYMRGIDFLNIPTTLLSMVDASVGGKTGIDFGNIKNLIGTFIQPMSVIIDVNFLDSLPEREFLSGFSEIIKHGLIKDKDYFEKVTAKSLKGFDKEELVDLIYRSIEIKKEIIVSDENEMGLRKLLNFGHTIGHAFEALSLETLNPLLHGEAISIGMVAEAKLSVLESLLTQEEFEKIETAIIDAGLPTGVSGFEIENLIEKMKSDKKNEFTKINFTLLKNIGVGVYDRNVSDENLKKTLSYVAK